MSIDLIVTIYFSENDSRYKESYLERKILPDDIPSQDAQGQENAQSTQITPDQLRKIDEIITELKTEINDLKLIGMGTDIIEELVRNGESALKRKDYTEGKSLLREAKQKVRRMLERKGGIVLIATLEHVLHKTKAKGLDTIKAKTMLDKAQKALETMNHEELEHIISDTKSVAKGMNIFVGSLASEMFSKARLLDLEKIEMVFSGAEKTITAEMARTKITMMKDMRSYIKEIGIDLTKFLSLIKQAEDAYKVKRFDEIEVCMSTFEADLDAAKRAHKRHVCQMKIKNVKDVMSKIKENGIVVAKPKRLLMMAERELSLHNLEKAEEVLDSAEKIVNELHRKSVIGREFKSIRDTLSEAKELEVDVKEANDLLKQAENELRANKLDKAMELIEKARNITSERVQGFIQGKYPKFALKLPEGGMEADVWNKCVLEIANIGDIIAKDIDITFQGDVEVKGIEPIEKLGVGEKRRMRIGVKPKEAGDVSLDVLLAYQRAFDETVYQLNVAKKLIVDASGSFVVEDVLLIHHSGLLINHVGRKMEADIDKDIFSGMLTAVQDFVGDSFRMRDSLGLKRMDFGTNKIMIEHGPSVFLTVVLVGGEPKYLPLYMLEVLREVDKKYGSVLRDWDGTFLELGGIEDVIRKLMQVTDERGADVQGFESSTVSSTIKLIEAARESGARIGGPDAFAQELIEAMEKNGFENACNYLETTEKEVKATGAMKRVRMEGADELKQALLMNLDEHILKDLGKDMEEYLSIIDSIMDIISRTREELGIKPTTPIKDVAIKSFDVTLGDVLNGLKTLFLIKMNVKNLDFVGPGKEWEGLNLEIIPNKDVIVRSYKAQAKKVERLLKHHKPWKIKQAIDKAGEYTLGVEGYPLKITPNMLVFKISIPQTVVVKKFNGGTVYINKKLTDELKAEGIAGELIEHINGMRKIYNVKDNDYIETQILIGDKIAEILENQKDHIASKTRSKTVEFPFENIFEGDSRYHVIEQEIEGEKVSIGIVVVESEEETEEESKEEK